ncbi:MAG: triose-phosphate isomerase [candidate division Zixibacteria bacterium]|nr:triose-phosphate isomerase [candidate division Zixibacteria bacterium]
MSRPKIIAGNWKMNCTPAETKELITSLVASEKSDSEVVTIVCPPFTSLSVASELLSKSSIVLGAQNLSERESGAYTAEISASMLVATGVKYVIIGHSERRQYYHETDSLINAKLKIAINTGLFPIFCVGETLKEREAGNSQEVVSGQLLNGVNGLSVENLKNLTVAYEPVWAIGTGKTATPEMAQDMHKFIRENMAKIEPALANSTPILYGGSVKPDNAAGLLNQPDIDGALVGGASLSADSFMKIIEAA